MAAVQDVVWAQAAFPEDWHMRKVGGVAKDYDPELCGKWTILCDMLDVWKRAGDKVLLFTNSLKGALTACPSARRFADPTVPHSHRAAAEPLRDEAGLQVCHARRQRRE